MDLRWSGDVPGSPNPGQAAGSRIPSLPVSLLRRAPWYVVPLAIFLLTRLVDAVLIVLVARDQIPASALARDLPLQTLVDPHSYFHVIANWDGQWYRLIAAHGYPTTLPTQDGVVQQNAWAFYPVFPLLVRLVMLTGASFGAAASVVSLTCGAAAMCVLDRMLAPRCGRFVAALTVLAVCCAPAAPILQVAYTEAVGLLLVLLALRTLEARQYGRLVLIGAVLALTRPITAPLALVAAAQLVARHRRRDVEPFPRRERVALALTTVGLAAMAVVWPVVNGIVVGDLSAYADTQRAWRKVAGSRGDSWLGSLVHGAPAGRWIVVVVALALLVLIAWRARPWTLGTRVWTVVYPVFILATTPATSSILRYLLLIGPAWWPAPGIGSRVTATRSRVLLASAVAVVGLTTQYLWIRSYLVITPDSLGHP
jgi:hypothetical protein